MSLEAGRIPSVGATPAAASQPDPLRREYLAFMLGNEAYAMDILQVREIRSVDRITRLSRVPPFICGVTNLRGVIVPVLDLRLRFGLPARPYSAYTVMIVVTLPDGRLAAMVVDSVEDVLAVSDEAMLPSPTLGGHMAAGFVRGLARVEDVMYVVLDARALLLAPESGLQGALP